LRLSLTSCPWIIATCSLFKLQLVLAIESYLSLQISGTALVLDEIINHVQSLQCQVEVKISSFYFFGFGGGEY
jgi:hypothetical protein